MKRAAFFSVIICLCILVAVLYQTAINPADFTGRWYSSDDQSAYLFQDGLIYSAECAVPISDSDSISGAYISCKDSDFLFARGIEGLQREKELFLVRRDNSCFLAENRNGTGKVYFIRYSQ